MQGRSTGTKLEQSNRPQSSFVWRTYLRRSCKGEAQRQALLGSSNPNSMVLPTFS